jgi:hypothetical protein
MKIRAILINSDTGIIADIQIEQGSLQDVYKTIGCKCIEAVRSPVLRGRDVLYVDEEGLLHDPNLFFKIEGYAQPLAGNGLVIGTNRAGDDVAAVTPLEVVKHSVQFMFDLLRV